MHSKWCNQRCTINMQCAVVYRFGIGAPDHPSVCTTRCSHSSSSCRDNQLQAFNRKLESLKWDMSAWRGFAQRKATRESLEAFQILNMNDGSAWDLLTSLMQYQPSQRLSASAALRHRWFGSSLLAPVGAAFDRVATSVGQVPIHVVLITHELISARSKPELPQAAAVLFAWWRERVAALSGMPFLMEDQCCLAVMPAVLLNHL